MVVVVEKRVSGGDDGDDDVVKTEPWAPHRLKHFFRGKNPTSTK